jgi:hypothetical protein
MLIRADFVSSGWNGDALAFVQNNEIPPMTIAVAAKSQVLNQSLGSSPGELNLRLM